MERTVALSWRRWIGLFALGLTALMLPMSPASGGSALTPAELLDAATAELSALLTPMQARTSVTVDAARIELEARVAADAPSSVLFKVCSEAVTRVERDSAKTSKQMHRIINRTVARLERMKAGKDFIDQGLGLAIYSEYVESRPSHASEDLFESLGEAIGYVF